jgi:sugar phosphate isomerase/epimerase
MMARPLVGFSSYAFAGESADYSVSFALEYGFDALELAFVDGALFRDGQIPSRNEARRIARRATGLSLSVHAPIDEVSLADSDHQVRQRSAEVLRQSMRSANALRAEIVVAHVYRSKANANKPPSTDEASRSFAAEHLAQLGREAHEMGVKIALENKGYSTRAVDRDYSGLRDLVDGLGLPGVAIAFDLGHAHVHAASCGGVVASAELFGDRICHYHVHDNDGSGDQHLGVGLGTVDFFPMVPRWLRGPTGLLIMEVFPPAASDHQGAVLASRSALLSIIDRYTAAR